MRRSRTRRRPASTSRRRSSSSTAGPPAASRIPVAGHRAARSPRTSGAARPCNRAVAELPGRRSGWSPSRPRGLRVARRRARRACARPPIGTRAPAILGPSRARTRRQRRSRPRTRCPALGPAPCSAAAAWTRTTRGPVGWSSAPALLLRRAALDSVDGYDPRYPAPACDDLDLADRLARAGWLDGARPGGRGRLPSPVERPGPGRTAPLPRRPRTPTCPQRCCAPVRETLMDRLHAHRDEGETRVLHDVEAVVLVGGKGTRLRPLTLSAPKPMLPTAGVPFLAHLLSRIRGPASGGSCSARPTWPRRSPSTSATAADARAWRSSTSWRTSRWAPAAASATWPST